METWEASDAIADAEQRDEEEPSSTRRAAEADSLRFIALITDNCLLRLCIVESNDGAVRSLLLEISLALKRLCAVSSSSGRVEQGRI